MNKVRTNERKSQGRRRKRARVDQALLAGRRSEGVKNRPKPEQQFPNAHFSLGNYQKSL